MIARLVSAAAWTTCNNSQLSKKGVTAAEKSHCRPDRLGRVGNETEEFAIKSKIAEKCL